MRRRKRRRLRLAEPEFHYNVYVVLLSKTALKDLSILRRNPARDPSKPAVYVGMTGLPVDHRFENLRWKHALANTRSWRPLEKDQPGFVATKLRAVGERRKIQRGCNEAGSSAQRDLHCGAVAARREPDLGAGPTAEKPGPTAADIQEQFDLSWQLYQLRLKLAPIGKKFDDVAEQLTKLKAQAAERPDAKQKLEAFAQTLMRFGPPHPRGQALHPRFSFWNGRGDCSTISKAQSRPPPRILRQKSDL
jgi:hypothetical protein